MVTVIDFLTLSSVAMVVTIDCRDTINCKVTIVLCNRALEMDNKKACGIVTVQLTSFVILFSNGAMNLLCFYPF